MKLIPLLTCLFLMSNSLFANDQQTLKDGLTEQQLLEEKINDIVRFGIGRSLEINDPKYQLAYDKLKSYVECAIENDFWDAYDKYQNEPELGFDIYHGLHRLCSQKADIKLTHLTRHFVEVAANAHEDGISDIRHAHAMELSDFANKHLLYDLDGRVGSSGLTCTTPGLDDTGCMPGLTEAFIKDLK